MTMLDLLMRPRAGRAGVDYFKDVQTKDAKYEPLLRPAGQAGDLVEQGTMDKYRPEMKKFYYDPTRYKTYLEQLGIKYPTRADGDVLGALRSIRCFGHIKAGLPVVPRERVRGRSRAQVIGDVEIGEESSVWMNVVMRGDVHCDPGRPRGPTSRTARSST